MTKEEQNQLRQDAEKPAIMHNPKVTDVLDLVRQLKKADDLIATRQLLKKIRANLPSTTGEEECEKWPERSLCTSTAPDQGSKGEEKRVMDSAEDMELALMPKHA